MRVEPIKALIGNLEDINALRLWQQLNRHIELSMNQEKFKSSYTISTTGNAGPKTNDSVSNVGQVFISVASKSGIFTEEFNFKGTRKEIIEQTVENAHKILYKNLTK